MKETKETYQVWFRDCKDYCVNYSEELDDAIEMANIGDAYNMEGMKAKYADFMVYAVKALSYGYLGRIISRQEFIYAHLHIAKLSDLFSTYVKDVEHYYNGKFPAEQLDKVRNDLSYGGRRLFAMIDDLADSLAFFVIKMKREEE